MECINNQNEVRIIKSLCFFNVFLIQGDIHEISKIRSNSEMTLADMLNLS